eukprot:TRINITY_DN23948_c1_g3_i3.p1 TRINITY_DN23948_c1_g3~~TRINITY_DN23948_c1_g3_i3.p1  ORF type:complete len:488 (-),score=46.63 TRINITY_DN23948_c1_g3_i3:162-1625(-)
MASMVHLSEIPDAWLSWLDAPTLLRVIVTGVHLSDDVEEEAWRRLCAFELGIHPSQLFLKGPTPTSFDTVKKMKIPKWRRVFYDLDTAGAHNELRHTNKAYEFFPSHFDEAAEVPKHLAFYADGAGKMVHCNLTGGFGGNRCVVASAPLPSLLSATVHAYPKHATTDELSWQAAYRLVGYYEVALGPPPTQTPGGSAGPPAYTGVPGISNRSQCVSVGLCTPRLSRGSIGRRQAGWEVESWALHGDDGNVFHGAGHGTRFAGLEPDVIRRRADPRHLQGQQGGKLRCTSFGEGDIVGCGIVHLLPQEDKYAAHQALVSGDASFVKSISSLQRSTRGIFFTLNGEYMGMPFLVDDVPLSVPLWPCVGVDAPWYLSFNFGQRPFCFDVDAVFSFANIQLSSVTETLEAWSSNFKNRSSRVEKLMPLVAKFSTRPGLGSWASEPVRSVVQKYQTALERVFLQRRHMPVRLDQLLQMYRVEASGDPDEDIW